MSRFKKERFFFHTYHCGKQQYPILKQDTNEVYDIKYNLVIWYFTTKAGKAGSATRPIFGHRNSETVPPRYHDYDEQRGKLILFPEEKNQVFFLFNL